jgi:hypothetical protein
MSESDRTSIGRPLAVWGGLLALVVAAALVLGAGAPRLYALRVVLALMAAGEAFAAFMQMFRARSMSPLTGRPYDAAYHGVVQDFGFYNAAVALLLALCAVDPAGNAVVLLGAIALYALHGGTHVLRYLGVYYGGETAVATRPRNLELRDGLPLLVALAGILLFYPR